MSGNRERPWQTWTKLPPPAPSSSDEEWETPRRRGAGTKSSRQGDRTQSNEVVVDLTSDQSDAIAVDDGRGSIPLRASAATPLASRVKSPSAQRSLGQRGGPPDAEQRGGQLDSPSANWRTNQDSPSLTLREFLEPSDNVLDLVQRKTGYLFSTKARKSLRECWSRLTKLKDLSESDSAQLQPDAYALEVDTMLKEIPKAFREQLMSAIALIENEVTASTAQKAPNADVGGGAKSLAARKSVPGPGPRIRGLPSGQLREGSKESSSRPSPSVAGSGRSNQTPETSRDAAKQERPSTSRQPLKRAQPSEAESENNTPKYSARRNEENVPRESKKEPYRPEAANAKTDQSDGVSSRDSSPSHSSDSEPEAPLSALASRRASRNQDRSTKPESHSRRESPAMVSTRRTANTSHLQPREADPSRGGNYGDSSSQVVDEDDEKPTKPSWQAKMAYKIKGEGSSSARLSPASASSRSHPKGSTRVESETDDEGESAHGHRSASQEEIDECVKKYFNIARDDHEYGVTNLLRKQKTVVKPYFDKGYKLPPSTLAAMQPIQFPTGTLPETQYAVRIAMEAASGKAKPTNRREYLRQTVEPFVYRDKPVHAVPGYSHYTSLEENILAENVVQLTYFPYRGDDNLLSNDQYEIELSSRYDFNPRVGSVEIQRISESQQALPYVEEVMDGIDVTYEAILEYLLSPDDPCTHLDLALPRDASCNEDFDRDSRKWMAIHATVRGNTDQELQRAAMLCASWKLVWGWSLWHVVKTSPPVEQVLKSMRRKYPGAQNIRQMTCCVCLLVDCNSHGELLEFIDNEDEEEYERARFEAREKEDRYIGANGIVPSHVKLRFPWHIENVNGINHRKYMVSLPRPVGERVPTEFPKKISTMYWRRTPESWDHYRRDPFYPCSHPGLCADAKCSCWLAKVPCEKACACPGGCDRRIVGCKCAQKGRPCSNREKCPCYALNRECDPDLCGKCGAKEVWLDCAEIHADMCNNVMIQRNIPRKTHLGTSTIHGLGLFMGEAVQAGEYIGEYKGEIITKAEAERRALIYDQRGTSYLFGLNNKQDVDAMHKGNKMRFINHSNQRGIKNVHPKVMLVNMVHRIGMYASRNIKAGEELFFNYGWEKDKTEGFKSMNEGAAASTNPRSRANGSGTTGTSTPVGAAGAAASAVATKTKAKSKAKRPAAIVLSNTVPEENVVDVFENEGEYQGNSGDEEPDHEQLPDADHIDSDDDSYQGSDGDAESE